MDTTEFRLCEFTPSVPVSSNPAKISTCNECPDQQVLVTCVGTPDIANGVRGVNRSGCDTANTDDFTGPVKEARN